jgi:LysM repeat protein
MKHFLQFRTILGLLFIYMLVFARVPAYAQSGTIHIVQPGDTLMRIASRYGVSPSALASANGLSWNAWVYVGQRLSIPGLVATPTQPTSGDTYIVRPGDTLTLIAIRHRLSTSELARANGLYWNSWLYVGQRLIIPGTITAPEPTPPPPPGGNPPEETGDTYVVQAGNTLFSIARWHGTTVAALRAANGLSSNTIYVGQLLKIPNGNAPTADDTPSTPTQPQPTPPPNHGASGEKWIDVNLTTQTITAYAGQTPVHSTLASTGTWATPTVVGTFSIYVKYESTTMSGPGYSLANVPHTMYFYRGYGIHGAYWHNNFGTPMSHGCVNLSLPDAEWFFNWAPVGTKVVTHY